MGMGLGWMKRCERRLSTGQALLKRIGANDSGATSIEYGLIATLMAVACIAAFSNLGTGSSGKWGNTANTVVNAMQSAK